jgi:hypothetical protein
VEQTAGCEKTPPIHPQTSMEADDRLKRSAVFPGAGVCRGDHSWARYVTVGWGPAHGRALELPNTALRTRRSAEEGIAKIFTVILSSKNRRSCEQRWKEAFEDYRFKRGRRINVGMIRRQSKIYLGTLRSLDTTPRGGCEVPRASAACGQLIGLSEEQDPEVHKQPLPPGERDSRKPAQENPSRGKASVSCCLCSEVIRG